MKNSFILRDKRVEWNQQFDLSRVQPDEKKSVGRVFCVHVPFFLKFFSREVFRLITFYNVKVSKNGRKLKLGQKLAFVKMFTCHFFYNFFHNFFFTKLFLETIPRDFFRFITFWQKSKSQKKWPLRLSHASTKNDGQIHIWFRMHFRELFF